MAAGKRHAFPIWTIFLEIQDNPADWSFDPSGYGIALPVALLCSNEEHKAMGGFYGTMSATATWVIISHTTQIRPKESVMQEKPCYLDERRGGIMAARFTWRSFYEFWIQEGTMSSRKGFPLGMNSLQFRLAISAATFSGMARPGRL